MRNHRKRIDPYVAQKQVERVLAEAKKEQTAHIEPAQKPKIQTVEAKPLTCEEQKLHDRAEYLARNLRLNEDSKELFYSNLWLVPYLDEANSIFSLHNLPHHEVDTKLYHYRYDRSSINILMKIIKGKHKNDAYEVEVNNKVVIITHKKQILKSEALLMIYDCLNNVSTIVSFNNDREINPSNRGKLQVHIPA